MEFVHNNDSNSNKLLNAWKIVLIVAVKNGRSKEVNDINTSEPEAESRPPEAMATRSRRCQAF